MSALWEENVVPVWLSIDEVWNGVDEVSYAGSFDLIRRDPSSPAHKKLYKPLVDNALQTHRVPEPRLIKSESSRTENGSAAQLDIFGIPSPGAAHSVPHSPNCCPPYGIHTQAFVGCDIEAQVGDRALLVKTLQQVVCGRVKEDRRATGFRYVPSNLLWLPTPHEETYDKDALVIVVPIMTLEEVKNWDPTNPSYWVMVLAGSHPQQSNPLWTTKLLYSRLMGVATAQAGEREKCTIGDIRKATTLLRQFVQANADVLTGRGDEVGNIVPEDLYDGCPDSDGGVLDRKNTMRATKTALTTAGEKVKVPKPFCGWEGPEDTTVVNVFKAKITPQMGTDPAPLASKASINLGHRLGQRALPTRPPPTADPNAELYEIAREEQNAALDSYRPATPVEVTVGATGSARRMTMSLDAIDDDNVSDLVDD